MKQELSVPQRVDWLRLIRSERVGPRTFARLLAQFGTATAALEALPDLARRGGRAEPLRITSRAEAEAELAAADTLGMIPLTLHDPDYPPALAQVETAPPLLYALGNPSLLRKTMIAVVGTRNASTNGIRFTQHLCRDLGQAGLTIISGMARGIDTAAHTSSLATGTVAVLAGGLDVIYPRENEKLYGDLRETGCLISEMPPGTQPQSRHFPSRNRLIAGAAIGLVLVEGAMKSGSVITADLANEFGRTVFAVPGHPSDPRAAGPNIKIREGATLIGGVRDILDELPSLHHLTEPSTPSFASATTPPDERELNAARIQLLNALSPSPIVIDSLIEECQLSPQVVAVVLLELELAGRVERSAGQKVSLVC